ncbi:MAG: hypothetical protein AB1649_30085 [Chloroflexota bacterium]
MNRSRAVLWTWRWCTTTQEILDESFEHIQLVFLLNQETVSLDHFAVVDYSPEDHVFCREYYTVVDQWPPGRYQLETQITFTKPIYDGWGTYPAGTFYVRYIVTVER